jgi:outer membrane protein TolC
MNDHSGTHKKQWQDMIVIFIEGLILIFLFFLLAGCVQRYDPVLAENLKARIVPTTTLPATPSSTQPATMPASTQATTQPGCEATQPTLPTGPLTLQAAIELAYAQNPALGQVKEEIEVAKGKKLMAFSAFLPQVSGQYGVFMRNKQPGFNVLDLPINFGLPIGEKQFQTAELQVQWMICDFGRSLSTFEQANLGVEICDLQYQRARETVAYQTTEFYFTVLRAQKFQVIARDAVRQAEAHLKTAKTFFEHGAVDKNDVLRAEVQVAETREMLVTADNAHDVATAALNRAMGINVNFPTQVVDAQTQPTFGRTIPECLAQAVECRKEFNIVQKAVQVAQYGEVYAKAEFLPKIYVGGNDTYVDDDYQLNKNLFTGGVGIQMDFFQGGRRIGQLKAARAGVQSSICKARQVCDGIAFEVREAYLAIAEAREKIRLSESAVTQSQENLRLINNKYAQGSVTPTDVVDAETLLTRSRQNYHNAVYDYLQALARLEYATGKSITSVSSTQPSR